MSTTTIIDHPISKKILEGPKSRGYTLYEKGGMAVTDRYCILYTGNLSGQKILLESYASPFSISPDTEPFPVEKLLNSFNTIAKGEIILPQKNIDFISLFETISFEKEKNKIIIPTKYYNLVYHFQPNKKIDYKIKEKNEPYKKVIVFSQNNLNLLISHCK